MQNKRLLLLFSIVVIILFIVTCNTISTEELPFMVAIRNQDGNHMISGWSDNNTWYFFLPGCIEMEVAQFCLNSDIEITLDGMPIYDGMSCVEFATEVPYNIEYSVFGIEKKSRVMFVQSSGVATLFLNTASESMKFVHAKKGNEESGSAYLYDGNGSLDCLIDQLTIKGRGNTTWAQSEKKPYVIRIEQETDLLGMGKAQKWILLADSADYSHIRNKLVYDFAAEIELPYSPESQWVDLYLNGEYAGLYLLCEKNEVHSERADIASYKSFLVSIEPGKRLEEQKLPYVKTASSQALRIHYPDSKILNDEKLAMIEAQWQYIENAIMSDDGVDPISGKHFRDLADMDSWVWNYLIDEVFGNMDCFNSSRYFYLDGNRDQKVHAGPVWDYDLSLGNDTNVQWNITNPNVMLLLRYKNDDTLQCLWTRSLYEHEWFQSELKHIFTEEMLPEINVLLAEKIDSYVKQIRNAAKMDSIRWLSGETESFDHSVSQLKTYLKDHIAFLKRVWLEGYTYHQLSFLGLDSGSYDFFYTVEDGAYLQNIPLVEDQETKSFVGWYYADTNEPFDIRKPITEDVELYAKWEDRHSRVIGQAMKLVPLALLGMIGTGMLMIDIKKSSWFC